MLLKREGAPLQETASVYSEFAGLRVSATKSGAWHAGLPCPAIARPEAHRPPHRPNKLEKSGYFSAGQELARQQNLGSCDLRIWVTSLPKEPSDDESDFAPKKPIGELPQRPTPRRSSVTKRTFADAWQKVSDQVLQGELRDKTITAYLCHRSLLRTSSPYLNAQLQAAEQRTALQEAKDAEEAVAKMFAGGSAKAGSGSLLGRKSHIVELELITHEEPAAFEEFLSWLYGKPLRITNYGLKQFVEDSWWPLLGLAMELQVGALEHILRTPLMELAGSLSLELSWGLIHLTAAHKLLPELQRACDEIARFGGRGFNIGKNKIQELPFLAANALFSSNSWIVNNESEIYEVLLMWLSGLPGLRNIADDEPPDPSQRVPEEILQASSGWTIRWGALYRDEMDKLAKLQVVPRCLTGDCERWRYSARIVLPTRKKDVVDDEKGLSAEELEEFALIVDVDESEAKNQKPKKFDLRAKATYSITRDRDVDARELYGADADINDTLLEQIKVILETQVTPGQPVPVAPGTKRWLEARAKQASSEAAARFLETTHSWHKAIDHHLRRGTSTLKEEREEKRSSLRGEEDKTDEERAEEVKKANVAAKKHLDYIPSNCSWMLRRRCHHRAFRLPEDAMYYFSRVSSQQDRLVLHCQRVPPDRLRKQYGAATVKDKFNRAPTVETMSRTDYSEKRSSAPDIRGKLAEEGRRAEMLVPGAEDGDISDSEEELEGQEVTSPRRHSDQILSPRSNLNAPLTKEEQLHVYAKKRRGGSELKRQDTKMQLSVRGAGTRLMCSNPVSGGRHEVLFRVLIKRPSHIGLDESDPNAKSLGLMKVSRAFTAGLRFGLAVNRGKADPPQEAGGSRKSLMPSRSMGETGVVAALPAKEEKPEAGLVEVLRVKDDSLAMSIHRSLQGGAWPPGGFLDVFIILVLDFQDLKLSFAVDAAFVKPFEDEFVEEEEQSQEEPESPESQTGRPPTRDASFGKPPSRDSTIGSQGLQLKNPGGDRKSLWMDEKKEPALPTRFIQERRFLKAWQSEEALQRDLKGGVAITKAHQAAAGPNGSYAPFIEVESHTLSALGGEGGEATLEILPAGALRPSWWLELMGNTIDMPRPGFHETRKWGLLR